ncbi:TIGR01457 family HAD-type hydrolase [Brevibacillus sp. H7]|uniref:TIGR01457 family HAD-type hydrolase n=1 Tax=Brevibacillus sp. H7 TaxID=3349138 RepID=UPI0037FED3B9
MKQYKGYLLDLDGTIYRGSEVIAEAVPFIGYLREQGIPFLYLTNNSSASPEHVADRLTAMGLPTSPGEVYTSSMATASFLAEKAPPGTPVYVIGEDGLRRELERHGFILTEQGARYVVVGIDRSFTYEKLATAACAIRNGAEFIATNCDPALPSERGLLPGNGSLVAAVSVASGVKPTVIGKPEPLIVRYALDSLGVPADDTLIVGDNLFTDIEAGANSGLDSLLVLTGYSTAKDAEHHSCRPTYIAADLQDWLRRLTGK